MAKFYTLGCYTAKGLGGFVSNPSTDRKAATSALAASVGAKVTRYAGLRGKYDFMAEIEGTFEQAAAASMVAVSSGAVSDFTILEDINLKNARGVLVNITAKKPTLGDQTEVADIVDEIVSEDANIIYGLVYDDSFGDDLQVTIVATGVDQRAPSLVIDNEPSMKLNPVGLNKVNTSQKVGTSSAEEIDFLDVPTFMRKQVD